MDNTPAFSRSSVRDALLHGWRVSLVAMFCYFTVNRIPQLHETYWAPIAAVVVLYPDLGTTEKAGFDRLLGTAIGSLVGWGSAVWWHGHTLFYGLSIFVSVAICYTLGRAGAARLCAVAVTVITIIPRPEPAHMVAIYRFIEVSYGVSCALAYMRIVDLIQARWARA